MSNVRYNAGTMTIEVDGLDDVSAVLGDLRKKTPAVAKVAINATARQARKLMIAEAKARYAVNSAGKRHLSDLVQRKKASNSYDTLRAMDERFTRMFAEELAGRRKPFPCTMKATRTGCGWIYRRHGAVIEEEMCA